jgi:hypothetical protein
VVHDSELDSERVLYGEELVLRFALDAEGREVYARTREAEGGITDTWTRYDAAGNVAAYEQASYDAPFFEDALDRWETRLSYDASGRLVMTEVFGVEGQAREPRSRTLHLYAGCL